MSTDLENSFHPQKEEKPPPAVKQALALGHPRGCQSLVLEARPPGRGRCRTVDLMLVSWKDAWRCPTCREGISVSPITPSVGGESACGGPRAPRTQPVLMGLRGPGRLSAQLPPTCHEDRVLVWGVLYSWYRLHVPSALSIHPAHKAVLGKVLVDSASPGSRQS